MPTCPSCGHKWTPAKSAPASLAGCSTDADRFAFYHATAPVEDLRFLIRPGTSLSSELRAEIERLLAGHPTALDAARMRTAVRVQRASQERGPSSEALFWSAAARIAAAQWRIEWQLRKDSDEVADEATERRQYFRSQSTFPPFGQSIR